MEPKNLQSCVTHPPIAVPHALKACAVIRTVDTNSLRNMRSFATMIHPSISRMSRTGQILRTSQCLITTTLKPTTIQALPNLYLRSTRRQYSHAQKPCARRNGCRALVVD